MDCVLKIKEFMDDRNINISSFVRDLKKDNPNNESIQRLTQQKIYLSFSKKRTMRLDEAILIIIQLKKLYPSITANDFFNLDYCSSDKKRRSRESGKIFN